MTFWLTWQRVVKGKFCFALARVVVDQKSGDVLDAANGHERFVGGKFQRMWDELEQAGWRMVPKDG